MPFATSRPDPYSFERPTIVACLLRTDTQFLTFADEREDSNEANTHVRYALAGCAYGWHHNSAGDIRFWNSYSGAWKHREKMYGKEPVA